MSSATLELPLSSLYVDRIADAIRQSPSVVKLCIQGPRPNVDLNSIAAIDTPVKAHRAFLKSRSAERSKLILRRWMCLCQNMTDLANVRFHDGLFGFAKHVDIICERNKLALRFAREAIETKSFDVMLKCWLDCPADHVAHVLLMEIYDCVTFEQCLTVMKHANEGDTNFHMVVAMGESIYWLFVEKATQVATKVQAESLALQIREDNCFDHEIPAVSALVRKIAGYYPRY